MKRSEFFDYVMKNLDKDEPFNMVYLKKNGGRREALGKIRDIEADKGVKGTGMNRQEKMDRLKVFQYFDINSNAYRSARLENIQSITIKGELYNVEDDET